MPCEIQRCSTNKIRNSLNKKNKNYIPSKPFKKPLNLQKKNYPFFGFFKNPPKTPHRPTDPPGTTHRPTKLYLQKTFKHIQKTPRFCCFKSHRPTNHLELTEVGTIWASLQPLTSPSRSSKAASERKRRGRERGSGFAQTKKPVGKNGSMGLEVKNHGKNYDL